VAGRHIQGDKIDDDEPRAPHSAGGNVPAEPERVKRWSSPWCRRRATTTMVA
jgi:hypothetical protein